ncbi:hypothetical protein Nepgr_032277 [Nepenthes gracilis]|uniref:Uncharacterized protein n=1 Tax=Nepenthes gracilis TaxID=150966 RepID=A0AAD3Y7R8_NEPGR|nr:hypothetical protein Nepgr_032277 [Nepenthes gracilis]
MTVMPMVSSMGCSEIWGLETNCCSSAGYVGGGDDPVCWVSSTGDGWTTALVFGVDDPSGGCSAGGLQLSTVPAECLSSCRRHLLFLMMFLSAICLIVTEDFHGQQFSSTKLQQEKIEPPSIRLHSETEPDKQAAVTASSYTVAAASHNFIWAIEAHRTCQLFPRESAYHQQHCCNCSQVKSTAPTTASRNQC